jgi:hypothetical protein
MPAVSEQGDYPKEVAMEVYRQTCQVCGSRVLRNHLVREGGETDRVVVQCAECHKLVAVYTLASRGYYHHEKGYVSYLRSLSRAGGAVSGKALKEEFEATQHSNLELFSSVLDYLSETGKLEE